MKVSLVIPVFNKAELTKRCLASVLAHSVSLEEVFVIDNASQDETPQVLQSFQERFQAKGIQLSVMTNPENKGFGAACNQGIRLAKGDWVAVLNNDTWVMPGWDQALIQAAQKNKLDLVGPFFDEKPVENKDDLEARARLFISRNGDKIRKHFVPILMFFKKSAIAKLKLSHQGIFDERFFVTYEDTDLLYRMKKLKMSYGQTSLCYLWHQSMGTRNEPGFLPNGYEQKGLEIFKEKWGFDPRPAEHTFFERLKRRYRKKRAQKGLF